MQRCRPRDETDAGSPLRHAAPCPGGLYVFVRDQAVARAVMLGLVDSPGSRVPGSRSAASRR